MKEINRFPMTVVNKWNRQLSPNKKVSFAGASLLIFLLIGMLHTSSFGQLSVTSTATPFTIDFDNTVAGVNVGQYNGTGFTPTPTAGQINSNAFALTGLSDGNLAFGDIPNNSVN
ncbi:MAG: hypothetical protein U5K79_18095 [Cyclobacteriaceae bacterium]|nr:hypothetical protein [Cyclobacteriaceae bacterium]